MSKLSWHDRKRGKCGMHLALNRKQFSHVNPSQLSAQTYSVTIVRKKFSEVCGVISSVFKLYLCFLPAENVQQMENANW